MSLTSRAATLWLLVFWCAACERPQQTALLADAVDFLEQGIRKDERLLSTEVSADQYRHRKDFILKRRIAALKVLRQGGESALDNPLVLWAKISPAPSINAGAAQECSHYLQIDWLQRDAVVTGFYLVMDDGETLQFPSTIVLDPVPLDRGRHPYIWAIVKFGQTQVQSNDPGCVLLDKEQREAIISSEQARYVGLILEGGLRTESGPLDYVGMRAR